MTLTFLNIDDQYQISLSLVFNNTTKEFKVIIESTTDAKISTFICTPGSSQYSTIEAPPVVIKIEDGKFQMTTLLLDKNDELYTVRRLSHNLTTGSYKIETEKLETWEKATFSCPPESTIFAFIEGLFINPPPAKILSMC